ncbi:MAG TPA: hypothetical protein VK689_15995 [Armatimonadota bacterium]|nr:hypothetical protein [Armatimonadota bacterium]
MRQTVVGLLIILGLARACGAAPPAAPPWQAALVARKGAAARQAAAGQWKLALREVRGARTAVEEGVKSELRALRKPVMNPAYRKELSALDQAAGARLARAGTDETARQAILREYKAKREALTKRHDPQNRKLVSALRARQVAVQARADLALASLDDLAAGYYTRGGNAQRATAMRQSALVSRLGAYGAMGQAPRAAEAATALLALGSRDPAAYRAAGEFFTEQRQHARAATAWERGIRLLEAGRAVGSGGGKALAPLARNRMLGEFYRQLAFTYSQLGKGADARRLLDKANKLDEASARPPARR